MNSCQNYGGSDALVFNWLFRALVSTSLFLLTIHFEMLCILKETKYIPSTNALPTKNVLFFLLFSGHLQTLLCLIESMTQHIQFVMKLLVFHEYFMESFISFEQIFS